MQSTKHLTGSIDRPIPVRVRADLQISSSVFQGETSWIVKDPVSLKYYRMREAEHEVLRMLDGKSTFREIQSRLADRFPDTRFKNHQLQTLIESFHTSGLLISDTSGQAAPLARRRAKLRRQKALGTLQSIVSIRFPGVDPERFLSWLYSKSRWAFSRTALMLSVLLMMAALMLVVTNWAEFQAKLPAFEKFFAVDNLVLLALLLVVTKTIHELGHGLACKHFGGECHEIGFMLLVLTPAMYCDTSDSWVLPNKWHRIAIGAAGVWVEVILASVCTFVWWYTHPGWMHFMCLNLMFLCGVSTLVFNINPLLRYDGYYMLSDYLEIPNLSQKSRAALIDFLRVHCLGMKPLRSRSTKQLALAVYSVLSFCYRCLVILLIFLFLTKVFEPYGLESIGYLAIAVSIVGMILIPLGRLVLYFKVPGRMRQVKQARVGVSLMIVALVVYGIVFVPLPHHVSADFVIKPADTQSVFVDWPGVLEEVHVRHGDRVQRGDLLARLKNSKLDLAIARLEMQKASLEASLAAKRREQTQALQQSRSLEIARRVGQIRSELAAVTKQLNIQRELRARLSLTANRDGFIIPPPNQIGPIDDGVRLAKWSNRPLDPENEFAFLQRKTLVCYVGNPRNVIAMLALPQAPMRYLRPGQKAELSVSSFRSETLEGTVVSVSRQRLDKLPPELSSTNQGPIAAAVDASEGERPMLPTYEAEVRFDGSPAQPLLPGMKGKAKVLVGHLPLAQRIRRYVATKFRFE